MKTTTRYTTTMLTLALLLTARGNQGGYRLAAPPEEITLGQILRATESSPTIMPCLSEPETCSRSDVCATRNIWMGLKYVIEHYVDGVTLSELAHVPEMKLDVDLSHIEA